MFILLLAQSVQQPAKQLRFPQINLGIHETQNGTEPPIQPTRVPHMLKKDDLKNSTARHGDGGTPFQVQAPPALNFNTDGRSEALGCGVCRIVVVYASDHVCSKSDDDCGRS